MQEILRNALSSLSGEVAEEGKLTSLAAVEYPGDAGAHPEVGGQEWIPVATLSPRSAKPKTSFPGVFGYMMINLF